MTPIELDPAPFLTSLSDCPKRLFALGDPLVLLREAVTVVGTRQPTADGLRAGFRFGLGLAKAGTVIVSGLARGVDTQAHEGALRAGGLTVAVLGHGLDLIYPSENRELARRILSSGGCLLSEYGPGTPPRKEHFPARNRLLAALSWATVVIEAGPKSGSLITARLALEQGRELFVVPGRFDAPSFSGSHRLIAEGARLVAGPEEVLATAPPVAVVEPGRLILAWFGPEGCATLSELFSRSRLSLSDLEARLEEAVASGRVASLGGQRYLWIA